MSTSPTVYWPFDPALVTEEFGTRGGGHGGIDGATPVGTPILASFDGVVVANFNDGASGSMWVGSQRIDANGPALITDLRRDDGLISRVAHLSGFAASPGQRVRAGDVIAYSGNSGFTTGPHTHWETRWDRLLGPGRWVNPRNFNPQIFQEVDMTPQESAMLTETFDRLRNMERSAIIEAKRNVNMEGAIIRLGKAVAAISEALAGVSKILTQSSGSPEVAQIAQATAKAVEDALADDFAAVPAQTADKLADRLKS